MFITEALCEYASALVVDLHRAGHEKSSLDAMLAAWKRGIAIAPSEYNNHAAQLKAAIGLGEYALMNVKLDDPAHYHSSRTKVSADMVPAECMRVVDGIEESYYTPIAPPSGLARSAWCAYWGPQRGARQAISPRHSGYRVAATGGTCHLTRNTDCC